MTLTAEANADRLERLRVILGGIAGRHGFTESRVEFTPRGIAFAVYHRDLSDQRHAYGTTIPGDAGDAVTAEHMERFVSGRPSADAALWRARRAEPSPAMSA